MEKEELYGRKAMKKFKNIMLEYYLITEDISDSYPILKSYGIRINKINHIEGGGKTVEMKQLNNVFYHKEDAEKFLKKIFKNQVTPVILIDVAEDYIIESLEVAKVKMRRQINMKQNTAV